VLVVSVSGPRGGGKTEVVVAIIRALISRGYRVAAAKKVLKDSIVREKPDTDAGRMEDSGAGTVAMVGRRRSRVTMALAPKTLEELLELLSAGRRVPPDAAVLEGFEHLVKDRPDVIKLVAAHGERDARAHLRGLADPVLGVCVREPVSSQLFTDSGSPVEVFTFDDLKTLAARVVEEAKRLRMLP